MVRLQTLGELRLEGEGSAALSSRRKELVLLTYLARRGPRPLSRDQAASLLWEDREERRSRQSLRQAVLELRRLVGDGLGSDADQVWLDPHAVELDAVLFEHDVDAGRWEEAIARWKGDFLVGLEDVGGEVLRTWLEAERESLRRRLRTALGELIARAKERGAWREGIAWAERWLSELPLDQQAHLQVLELLHLDRQTGEALARDAAFRVDLAAAGLTVSQELAQLARALTRAERSTQQPHASAVLLSPDLVGRGLALGELNMAWQDVLRGSGAVVLVEGELGIGKTRLCEEFARRLATGPSDVGVYAAPARQDPEPEELGVVRRLAGALARAAGLPGAPASALAALARIAPAVRERFPTLPEAEGSPETLAEAFREAVAAVAEESPTLLLVDDLPQADPASRTALLALAEHVPARCLLLVTARTGPDAPPLALRSDARLRRLKLQPLALPEVELVLSSILELPPDERHQLAARLHQQGGGNPFYIVELVSALADEGTLAPTERGAWRLTTKGDRLPLPTSIRDVIGRRVARLSPPGRSALEAAAILALPFDRELLAEVAGESPVAVEAGLEELMLHRLIREAEAPGRYQFAHELVRRHVSQTVPLARAEETSQRAVAALERRASGDPTAVAALAQHRARLRAPGAARQRRRRIAIVAVLVAGALGSAGLLRRDAGGVPPVSTIAVLPFSVSGGADLAYLREGIVTLLSTQLDGGGALRSADPRAVLGVAAQVHADARGSGATDGRDPAITVARRVGAGTYVRGSIVEVGGRLLIEATAHRPGNSQPIARAQVEGPIAELFGLVDNLAGRLLSGLSDGPFEQLTRIAATTTTSLPALKAYLEGERHFRAGSFEDAARAFRHAAREDTTFALAYYWLSVAAWWTDDAATLDQAAAAAVRFSSRLRPQDRRILDGWQAFLHGDTPGAERIYRAIVRDEPEHVEAWLQLGELLFHAGPRRGRAMSEARPAFERVVEFEPEHISAVMHLSRIAAADGRLRDLDSLSRRALRIGATGEWATEARLHLAFTGGDARALDAVLVSLRTQPEGRSWNGAHYIALAHDNNIAGARRLVTILTDATRTARVRAFGHIGLAYLALAEGRLRAAGEELGRAAALDPAMALEYRGVVALLPFLSPAPGELAALRDSALRLTARRQPALPRDNSWPTAHDGIQQDIATYLSAALALRAGDVMAARQGRDQLSSRSRRTPPDAVVRDLAASLRAQLAVSANRPTEALRELEQLQAIDARADQVGSSPYYSQGLERFTYASLLEASGQLEKAAYWYGSFSAISIFDLVFLAPSHLRRGSIAERLGRPAEAQHHYQAALALWAACDEELRPLTDNARTRLVALGSETAAAPPRQPNTP